MKIKKLFVPHNILVSSQCIAICFQPSNSLLNNLSMVLFAMYIRVETDHIHQNSVNLPGHAPRSIYTLQPSLKKIVLSVSGKIYFILSHNHIRDVKEKNYYINILTIYLQIGLFAPLYN